MRRDGVCVECEPSQFSETDDVTPCATCSADKYSEGFGAAKCRACPLNHKGPEGSDSADNCFEVFTSCEPGDFMAENADDPCGCDLDGSIVAHVKGCAAHISPQLSVRSRRLLSRCTKGQSITMITYAIPPDNLDQLSKKGTRQDHKDGGRSRGRATHHVKVVKEEDYDEQPVEYGVEYDFDGVHDETEPQASTN